MNWELSLYTEACPGFFSLGADSIFSRGGKKITKGRIAPEGRKKISTPWAYQTRGGGAEYLIITKEGIVLASASYAPNESYFYQGQKYTILNFLSGRNILF